MISQLPTLRVPTILTVLVMACAALMVTATTAQAAEAEFKIVNHNLGSGVESDLNDDGNYAGHGSAEDPITRVVNRIQAENPHVATLQEVCQEDVQRMLNQLGSPWVASTFAPTQPANPYPSQYNNSCEDNRKRSTAKGNVMLSRVGIWPGEDSVTEVGYYAGRHITLGCMNVYFGGVLGGRTQVCNTHLTAGTDPADVSAREAQAEQIRQSAEANEAQVPYVLAGDFNSNPKTFLIDKFHAVNRDGTAFTGARFFEGDHECGTAFGFCRAGDATQGVNGNDPRKIDYVFFGRHFTKFAKSVDLYTRASDTSSHEVITASTIFEW